MGKYIEGFVTDNNLKKWADYAKQNSYTRDTAQTKRDLNPVPVATAEDYSKGPKQ
jgi:hypothetical protein